MTAKSLYLYCNTFSQSATSSFWSLLFESIQKEAQTHNQTSLIIVPSKSLKFQIMEMIWDKMPASTALPQIATLDDFILENTPPLRPIALKHCLLKEIEAYTTKTGWTTTIPLESLLEDLQKADEESRKFNIPISSLKHPSDQNPIKDHMINILLAYQKAKSSLKLKDKIDIYLDHQKHQFQHLEAALSNRAVFITGFWDIPPYQLNAIQALLKFSASSYIQLNYNPDQHLYLPSESLYDWFLSQGLNLREIHEHKVAPSRPQVNTLVCNTIEDEVNQIAAQVLHQVHHKNIPLDQIGIIIPSESLYLAPLQNALSKLDIGSNQTTSIGEPPLLKWSQLWLQFCSNAPSKKRLQTLIAHPSFNILSNKTNTRLALTQYQNDGIRALKETPIETSYEDWLNTCKKTLPLSAKTFFEALFAERQTLRKSASYDQFKRTLKTQLENWAIENITTEKLDRRSRSEGGSTLNLAISGIESVCKELDIFPYSLSRCATEINMQLKALSQTEESPLINTLIYTKNESYLVQKSCWICCGFTDQLWPQKASFSGLLNNATRKRLGLHDAQTLYNWDRFLFMSASHLTLQDLVITRPHSLNGNTTTHSGHLESLKDNWGIAIKEIFISPNQIQEKPLLATNQQRQYQYLACLSQTTMKPQPIQTPYWQSIITQKLSQPMGITSLESYQKCPQRYVFESLFKLSHKDPYDEEPDPGEWGTLVHDILQDFNTTLMEKHITPQSATKEICFRLITDIAKHKCNQQPNQTPLWQLKIQTLFGTDTSPGLLENFIEKECEKEWDLHPLGFEVPFESTLHYKEKTLALRGKIDALYQSHNGKKVAIVDYKTGKNTPGPGDITHHRHLQMGTYLNVTEHLYPEKEAVGATIVKLNPAMPVEHALVLSTPDDKKNIFNETRKRPAILDQAYKEHLTQYLFGLLDLMKEGYFQPEPPEALEPLMKTRPAMCQNCTWKPSCTYKKRFQGWGA